VGLISIVTSCGIHDWSLICIITGCVFNDRGLISIVTSCGTHDWSLIGIVTGCGVDDRIPNRDKIFLITLTLAASYLTSIARSAWSWPWAS
jgi:regulation of enolase protein 1 (concanavalin A-like superfamily)